MRLVSDYARIRVPATARVGGSRDNERVVLAFDYWDDFAATITTGETRATVTGPSRDIAPRDYNHPTIQAMYATLDAMQAPRAGVTLIAQTTIPPAVGLGARTAAVMAGIILVRHLLGNPTNFSDSEAVNLAVSLGVAPDRAYAALHGGISLHWKHDRLVRSQQISQQGTSDFTVLIPRSHRESDGEQCVSGPLAMLLHALVTEPNLLPSVCPSFSYSDSPDRAVSDSIHLLLALHKSRWPALMLGSGPAIVVCARVQNDMAEIFSQYGFTASHARISSGATVISAQNIVERGG
ncbi:GHMP family kinase ATP-binding protein [Arcanobacterium phocae]|uniref:GHMP family kinase ATP-binding protein n=1 Tax=Arcanobacterium phocae TaxID=131112 RepID=UPI001C0EE3C0|nr:hypothetical protein [Arcanobacterium phocae]